MENKELENKQLNDEQVADAAGGNVISDIYNAIGDAAKGIGKVVADKLEPFVEPVLEPIIDKFKPEPPKPNPLLDPDAFKIPDIYDPMK